MTNGYDVIGDVHGNAAALEQLLERMGYRLTAGVWEHSHRRVVFVGDLIDRCDEQRRTIEVARAMSDAGTALIVMGNHEFNAINYATPLDDTSTEFLRSHSDKHHQQHKAFLRGYPFGSADHLELIEWFKSIPMWLDLGGLRVVHACWSDQHIETLRPGRVDDRWTDEILRKAGTKATTEYDACEVILKGPEVTVPDGYDYLDKGGHCRESARYAWWSDAPATYANRLVLPPDSTRCDGTPHPGFPDTQIPPPLPTQATERTPTIVGHYWFTRTPKVIDDHTACVDYSAGVGGPLVAYRWSGETTLTDEHFIASR